MSTVEEAANQAITTFIQTLRLCAPREPETAARLDEDLRGFAAELQSMMHDRLGYIFIGGSSRLICDMPGQRHAFSGNHSHCRHCGADFCPPHSASPCPKCNQV